MAKCSSPQLSSHLCTKPTHQTWSCLTRFSRALPCFSSPALTRGVDCLALQLAFGHRQHQAARVSEPRFKCSERAGLLYLPGLQCPLPRATSPTALPNQILKSMVSTQ